MVTRAVLLTLIFVLLLVASANAGIVKILGATIHEDGSIKDQDGDWIATTGKDNTGEYTLEYKAKQFGPNDPRCWCQVRGGNQKICKLKCTDPNNIRIYIFDTETNSPKDGEFDLFCMNKHIFN